MKRYLLAHDLGTSGDKATLFSLEGSLIDSTIRSYQTYYSNNTWAEQNPSDWWKAVCDTTRKLLQKRDADEIAAVAFSGQMMGCLCVDGSGTPLRNSIIYSDQRAVKETAFLVEKIGGIEIYRITGHRASPSYSIEKLMWLKRNEPETYKNTYKMLNAKDYINLKLTGTWCTEYNDASGTNAFDIVNRNWSDRIIEAAEIDQKKLPEAFESVRVIGEVTREAAEATGLRAGTPVVAGAGDGGCATVGVGSIREGITYNYIGSSSWISTTTKFPIFDDSLRTFTWVHPVPGYFQPCGTMQTAGSSYNWLKEVICRDEKEKAALLGISPYDLINEEIARSPAGANGLIFLPYLLGERSPRWNPDAKGAWVGLRLETKREDVLRSVLEGITFNLEIILSVMKQFVPIHEIIVIGGGAKSRVWLKILADMYGIPVVVPSYLEEATSMGAAIVAGVGTGCFENFDVAKKFFTVTDRVEPDPESVVVYGKIKPVFDRCYYALEGIFSEL